MCALVNKVIWRFCLETESSKPPKKPPKNKVVAGIVAAPAEAATLAVQPVTLPNTSSIDALKPFTSNEPPNLLGTRELRWQVKPENWGFLGVVHHCNQRDRVGGNT